jgi:hypothetical protein
MSAMPDPWAAYVPTSDFKDASLQVPITQKKGAAVYDGRTLNGTVPAQLLHKVTKLEPHAAKGTEPEKMTSSGRGGWAPTTALWEQEQLIDDKREMRSSGEFEEAYSVFEKYNFKLDFGPNKPEHQNPDKSYFKPSVMKLKELNGKTFVRSKFDGQRGPFVSHEADEDESEGE